MCSYTAYKSLAFGNVRIWLVWRNTHPLVYNSSVWYMYVCAAVAAKLCSCSLKNSRTAVLLYCAIVYCTRICPTNVFQASSTCTTYVRTHTVSCLCTWYRYLVHKHHRTALNLIRMSAHSVVGACQLARAVHTIYVDVPTFVVTICFGMRLLCRPFVYIFIY